MQAAFMHSCKKLGIQTAPWLSTACKNSKATLKSLLMESRTLSSVSGFVMRCLDSSLWQTFHGAAGIPHYMASAYFSIKQIWAWNKFCQAFCHCLVFLINERGINAGTTLLLINSNLDMAIIDTAVLIEAIFRSRYSVIHPWAEIYPHVWMKQTYISTQISNQLLLVSLFSTDILVWSGSPQTSVYRCVLSKDISVANKTTLLLSLEDA